MWYCWGFIVFLGYMRAWLTRTGCVSSCWLETVHLGPLRCLVNREIFSFLLFYLWSGVECCHSSRISIRSESYVASSTSPGFVRLSGVLMQVPWKVRSHDTGLNRT